MKSIKLEQYIAAQTAFSRRDILALIVNKKIVCNGHVVTDISMRIDPKHSHVMVDGSALIKPPEFYYFKFHKPKNMICTLSDPQNRRCLSQVIKTLKYPLFPVGRLDRDTTGLLLLTNDGSFCQSVIHPTNAIKKVYSVTVSSSLDNKTLSIIRTGFFLDDGPVQFESFVLTDHNQIQLTIIEGRNRIIRRAFEMLGFEVIHLKRISIGGISLGKLKMGDVRPLTPKERDLFKRS